MFIFDQVTQVEIKNTSISASSVELAIFEVLESVPKHISFEHAAELFHGMVNLRPKIIQSLLERNNSIKTNRLFLFLAHYYDHTWLKKLDESKVKLSKGKSQVTF